MELTRSYLNTLKILKDGQRASELASHLSKPVNVLPVLLMSTVGEIQASNVSASRQ